MRTLRVPLVAAVGERVQASRRCLDAGNQLPIQAPALAEHIVGAA